MSPESFRGKIATEEEPGLEKEQEQEEKQEEIPQWLKQAMKEEYGTVSPREKAKKRPTGKITEVGPRVYDKVRVSVAGEGGWFEAEVVGREGDALKLAMLDGARRIRTIPRDDIAAIDIIERALTAKPLYPSKPIPPFAK